MNAKLPHNDGVRIRQTRRFVRPDFFYIYFATAKASWSLTERSLETPSVAMVTP